MPNIQSIRIYKINDLFFFRAYSQTTKGMYMEYGPYFIINEPSSVLNIGQQILRTFEECKTEITHPEDLTKLSVLEKEDPYSKSEESKLLKKLKKTGKDLRLGIQYYNDEYQFVPSKVRNKDGATPMYDKKLTSDGNPENLGKTLLQAFELCE